MVHFKRITTLICVMMLVLPAQAQMADLAFVETRAEATNFLETTRYDEVMAFLEVVAESSSNLHLTSFGYSVEGRSLPLLIFGRIDGFAPHQVQAPARTRVLLQANIHGGEVEGKEALLMMVRAMAEGRYDHLLDSLVVLMAPIYNADGNERISLYNRPRQHGPLGGMGTRANAQGYNLNRDHTKLDTPEARSLIALLNDYDPHVVVDLHATNGTRHGYHLTYSPPLHPSTSPAIVDFLRDEWLPTVTERVKGQHDIDMYYYGNLPWPGMDAPRGWYTFDHRPRFNNNYVGLRNRFAILSESYAYMPFRERVEVTRIFVDELLAFALQNAGRIRSLTDAADREPWIGREIALRASFERSDEPVSILMGDVAEEVHPHTGEIILRRLDVRRPEEMYEYGTFAADEVATVPQAYLISGANWRAVEILRAHGVTMEMLEEDVVLEVERFRIDSTWVEGRPFEQHHMRTLEGAYETLRMEIPAGWCRIEMTQALAPLAALLLEPRSDDGLVNWNVMDEEIEDATHYPVLRVPAADRTSDDS